MKVLKVLSLTLLTASLLITQAHAAPTFTIGIGSGGIDIDLDGGSDDNFSPRPSASETYTLEMDGSLYRQGDMIRLKQELLSQFPELRRKLDNAKLESLTVLAKSRRGSIAADLEINRQYVDSKSIQVAPRGYTFQDTNRRSYNRVDFNVPRRQDAGAWTLSLDGAVKVHTIKVTVKLRGAATPRPRWENINLGNFQMGAAILPQAKTYRVNEVLKSLTIASVVNPIQIVDVTVDYQNGNSESLQGFQVLLFPGQELEQSLNQNQTVRRITITAASIGANGQLQVEALAQRMD